MSQKKVKGALKSAFAVGAVLGGASIISDVDVVYAKELQNELLEEEELEILEEEAGTSEAPSESLN